MAWVRADLLTPTAWREVCRSVATRTFGISTSGPARFDITRLVPLLEAVHEGLAGVWVDCLGWEAFIERWDRPKTLFYLGPPYLGTEHYYGRGLFERSDFERLSAALQCLQGRFTLSLNDVPDERELFAWASIETVELSYQAGGAGQTKRGREVIISRSELRPSMTNRTGLTGSYT